MATKIQVSGGRFHMNTDEDEFAAIDQERRHPADTAYGRAWGNVLSRREILEQMKPGGELYRREKWGDLDSKRLAEENIGGFRDPLEE